MYKLDHIAIQAKDPTALSKWYCEALNLEIVYELIDRKNRPFYFLRSKNGDCMIEILATENERKERLLEDPGYSHVCFKVEDFDRTVLELRSKGISIDERTTKHGWKIGFFRDPEGNFLEIIKR